MTDDADWRPSASLTDLRIRADTLRQVRQFFAERSVLEVDTPLLVRHTVTDPAIESVAVQWSGRRYLHTSPEYAMKRLLANGSGDIYQICHVFRSGELGRRHNPEFTMVEWYRVDYSLQALIDETVALICAVLQRPRQYRMWRFRDLIDAVFAVDALHAPAPELHAAAAARGVDLSAAAADERDALLDVLYDHALGKLASYPPDAPGEQAQDPADGAIHVIVDFPVARAALARIGTDEQGDTVARRFEVIVDGVEVANGYDELRDAVEQAARFEADRGQRRRLGKSVPDADPHLLAALREGLPACCGVALGLDRLLMLKLGRHDIAQVMPFGAARA